MLCGPYGTTDHCVCMCVGAKMRLTDHNSVAKKRESNKILCSFHEHEHDMCENDFQFIEMNRQITFQVCNFWLLVIYYFHICQPTVTQSVRKNQLRSISFNHQKMCRNILHLANASHIHICANVIQLKSNQSHLTKSTKLICIFT